MMSGTWTVRNDLEYSSDVRMTKRYTKPTLASHKSLSLENALWGRIHNRWLKKRKVNPFRDSTGQEVPQAELP